MSLLKNKRINILKVSFDVSFYEAYIVDNLQMSCLSSVFHGDSAVDWVGGGRVLEFTNKGHWYIVIIHWMTGAVW